MKNNYRLKFSKLDRMRFIGHLDLLKLFQMTIRKCDIPISYSKGFNPHQIMSFANPLPLGFKSIAEYVDITLESDINPEEIKNKLFFPDGIEILEVVKINPEEKNGASFLEAAKYSVTLPEQNNFQPAIDTILNSDEVFIEKKNKKGISVVDIRKDIFELKFFDNQIEMLVSCGSKQNLKPESLVKLIYEMSEINYNPYKVQYLRQEMYKKINNEFIKL